MSGCWLWTAGLDTSGYGQFRISGRLRLAHIVAYEAALGPHDQETLDHLCRVEICVNPAHLEPVPNRVNIQRGGHSLKTHCPKGHPYDMRQSNGGRACRQCFIDGKRQHYAKTYEPKRSKDSPQRSGCSLCGGFGHNARTCNPTDRRTT
jgi:hypothetical protein